MSILLRTPDHTTLLLSASEACKINNDKFHIYVLLKILDCCIDSKSILEFLRCIVSLSYQRNEIYKAALWKTVADIISTTGSIY